jgi:hypothetical protein
VENEYQHWKPHEGDPGGRTVLTVTVSVTGVVVVATVETVAVTPLVDGTVVNACAVTQGRGVSMQKHTALARLVALAFSEERSALALVVVAGTGFGFLRAKRTARRTLPFVWVGLARITGSVAESIVSTKSRAP